MGGDKISGENLTISISDWKLIGIVDFRYYRRTSENSIINNQKRRNLDVQSIESIKVGDAKGTHRIRNHDDNGYNILCPHAKAMVLNPC